MLCQRCNREVPDDAVLCCYCGRVFQRKASSRGAKRRNGAGTAFRRGKYWTAKVTIGWSTTPEGARRQITRTKGGFKTKSDALDYCLALKQQAERPALAPTVAEYWDMYSASELEKLSESKQVAYKIAWGKLQPIAARRIDTLTVHDLRSVVNTSAKTYYPARDMKVVLNHLFYLAAADRWVAQDLPSFIILPEKNETPREPFTEEEQAAIWRAYESGCTDAAMALIMIYTGMMTGEMRQLTVDMIDYDNRRIVGVGLKTKIRRESPVYLPDDIIPVLQDVSAGQTGRLWPCSEDDFYARYYAALETAGVRRLTPYSCRHTTATALAITENIAPETVRKVMRWTSTSQLRRYAHPNDPDALAAINTLKKL